jgi:SAM-dependent methyltransferase
MVLHHALETCPDPRGGLREAARVLAPGARLVVCAFNPLSLWGLRRAYAHLRDDAFTGLRLVSLLRLLDWLALLGFEVQGSALHLCYTLPFRFGGESADAAPSCTGTPGRIERIMRRHQAPVGGAYLIVATKQAMALRPNWRTPRVKAHGLVPAAYPKSAVQRGRAPAPVLNLQDWKGVERDG